MTREYDFAADYDAQYSAAYEPEIRTLTELALGQNGAILDLCCGTGIVTVPLAETGLEVIGVDISPTMLEQAKTKVKGQKNLTFHLQDALTFSTSQRFGLVLMTGNAFQCFLTEENLEALFEKVYALLNPGGVFVFDTRLPEGYDFTLSDDFELWSEHQDAAGNAVRWLGKQAAYNPEDGVLHYEMKEVYGDGTERPSSEILKFTALKTLFSLAQNADFEVVGQYENWNRKPLQENPAACVLELKKPS